MYSGLLLFLLSLKTILATDRPIIGVLIQEIEPDDPLKSLNYTSYVAASYVKAVEASGARVVPVFIRREYQYYKDLADKLNGFLYTGGNSNLMAHNGVARSGKFIMDLVLEKNKEGIHLPILGVCQGFELLSILSNNWQPILTSCSVENEILKLKMLPGFRNSSLYKTASDDDINTLINYPSTSNHHGSCLTQKNITRFNLTQWQILSTSISNEGFTFISSMEWRNGPIAAVQFHPEKSPYEWKPHQANPHDAKSVKASRIFYDWLVSEARKNNNSFRNSTEERDHLIYNFSPVYSGKDGGYDTQDYGFYDPPTYNDNAIY